jgi:tRNA(adenine34) deaminase
MEFTDEYFMKIALLEAKKAFDKNEIPVGAIIVLDNKIIARAHNMSETLVDFTAHAELQAFTSASSYLNSKYLNDCTLYVTLEPCIMCAGAAFWTRIGRIVIGASDDKRGFSTLNENILHPKTKVTKEILQNDCKSILDAFFKKLR